MRSSSQLGFTLLELALVVALLVVITSVSTVFLVSVDRAFEDTLQTVEAQQKTFSLFRHLQEELQFVHWRDLRLLAHGKGIEYYQSAYIPPKVGNPPQGGGELREKGRWRRQKRKILWIPKKQLVLLKIYPIKVDDDDDDEYSQNGYGKQYSRSPKKDDDDKDDDDDDDDDDDKDDDDDDDDDHHKKQVLPLARQVTYFSVRRGDKPNYLIVRCRQANSGQEFERVLVVLGR